MALARGLHVELAISGPATGVAIPVDVVLPMAGFSGIAIRRFQGGPLGILPALALLGARTCHVVRVVPRPGWIGLRNGNFPNAMAKSDGFPVDVILEP
jgi:hypothetical protein